MGRADYYKKGSWKVVCDVCGMFYHSNDLKMRWDGLMCCRQDWNIRQPQDFVRGIPDPQAVPWSRPDVRPQFVSNPVTLAITDFFGEYLVDFVNDIMVAFATTVLPVGVFASVDKAQLGGELQLQDMQVVDPYFYVTPGSRLDNTDVEGLRLNNSELS
jgi:hypothetical protein